MQTSSLNYETLPNTFCLRNVDIWNSDGVLNAQDVVCRDGRIESIGPVGSFGSPPTLTTFDSSGLALLPSGIDAQVHLRVPGQSEKETPLSGLRAALKGGYAAILTMPNTKPVLDNAEILLQARDLVRDAEVKTGVEVLWSAAVTRGQEGKAMTDFVALTRAGAKAFTDDGKGVASDSIMEQAFRLLESVDRPFLQHAETPGHGGILAPGPIQEILKVKSYSPEAEWSMVERDLRILRKYPKARYHVLHVSAKETVALIRDAKREGLRVSGEVSPHHLHFSSNDLDPAKTSFKMNPPIRSEDDRELLLAGLNDGTLDFVATDHAPHESGAKTNFTNASFGTTGLETALWVLLDLYQRQSLSAPRLVEVFSTAPARFLGIETEYGRLQPGRKLNAVLINPNASPRKVCAADLESLSKNNCFLDRQLGGEIVRVYQPGRFWTSFDN